MSSMPPEVKVLTAALENSKILPQKHFKDNPILPNFKNLSTIFCPRL